MPDNFGTCLAFTLKEEGGYSDDPADPGGATNMGITLATYRQWADNPNLAPLQVRDLSERTARAIYRSLYWNPLRADALPAGVDLSVFDMGVNAGIWGSARLGENDRAADRRIRGGPRRERSPYWQEAGMRPGRHAEGRPTFKNSPSLLRSRPPNPAPTPPPWC